MRIAHVSAAMDHGGAERILADLALSHAAEGHDVALVAPAGSLDRDWAAAGVRRILVPAVGRNPAGVLRTALAVRRALGRWRPDVVHAHNVKATGFALAAARGRRRRVPLLTTFHGVPAHELAASARILRHADLVAVVSGALAAALEAAGLASHRITTVVNGIDEPPPADALAALDTELELRGDVVAAVGRLAPVKAHDRLLGAAARVLERRPQTTFLIVGDGECRAALEELAGALGIAGSVRFTGTRDDARALIARADVLVFSSLSEGLSIAALEALAAGTPVVSTDVPGMSELLGDGAGTVVAHDPEGLAGAIVELLADPERRRRMGAAGRRLVAERFSATAMRAAYARIYEQLVGAR